MHTVKGGSERGTAQVSKAGQPPSCAHSVQFYEDPAIFLDQLAGSVGSALGSGGACLVICTPEHRSELADRLAKHAIDLQMAAELGRYTAVDAGETLACFMVEGWPDRELFFRTIEPLLERANTSVDHPRPGAIFAFGEMVTLLWEGGHYDAAIQLEQLWNDLGTQHAFSLLCAYPLSSFAHESQHELFRRICQEHSQVIPAESYTASASESERMRLVSALQQRAAAVHSAVEEREQAIAQRKHVEDKLWRSEEFARRVVESCVDCVKVLDLEGRLEYVSPSGQAALDIGDMRSLLGRPWAELWREEDRPRVEAAVRAAMTGRVGAFQADLTTANGTRKCWDVRIAPMRERDGAIERLLAVARDITELRQAQQIALQAEKLASAGRMAATIAHEINNPLEAVTNFIYLARTTPDVPERAAHCLDVADRELKRVAQIAKKTLGFYRDTSKRKWITLSEAVDDVFLIYERKLRSKKINTTIEVDAGLKVCAKEGELKQALSNLLSNALDASREGGSIWLRAHPSCKWTSRRERGGAELGIRISLADNGAGIAPDVKKRIFMPFFTTKATLGTGIGLWVTKSLIEQEGGSLDFRSRQGERSGTVMSFFLPAGPQAQELKSAA